MLIVVVVVEHFECAKPAHALGVVLKKQKDWEQSARYLQMALNIRRDNLGDFHQQTGETMHALANTYLKQNMFDKALELYAKTAEIVKVI